MKQLMPPGMAPEPLQIRPAPVSMYSRPEHRDLSFAQIFLTLRKRKWIVLASLAAAAILAWEASVHMTPKYEAVGLIEVNKEASDMVGDAMSSMIEDSGAADSLDYNITLQTHAKALQSDTLTFEVAEQLGLEKRPEFRLSPPWSRLLPGPSLTPEEIDAEYQKPLDQSPARRALLSKVFEKTLTVKTIPGTRLIEVHFLSPNPEVAADVVNKLIGDYIEQYFRTRYAATAQASEWLSKELSGLKKEVDTGELKVVEAQKRAGLLGAGAEVHSMAIVKLEGLSKQLTDAEGNRILAEAVDKIVKTGNLELISIAAAGSGLTSSPAAVSPLSLLESLRAQEAQLKVQYAQASTKYGAAFPALVQLRNQIADLDSSIQAELNRLTARANNDFQIAKATEDRLRESFEQEKAVAEKLNDSAIQYTIQKHEVEVNRDLYDTLLAKLKGAGILSGLQSTNLVVVDPARTTPSPARPIYPLNMGIGLGVGLLGGIALAFIKEGTDNTLRSAEQVEEVASLPTLSVIPEFRGQNMLTTMKRGARSVWCLDYPSSAAAEAYRLLRTSVLLTHIDCPPKVIMVTSALPKDGKSTTSINTAITLAQQGHKVLLVDADLRRPKVDAALNLPPVAGLTGMIVGEESQSLTYQPREDVPTLSILAAGIRPPNPAELLGSARMAELVKRWRAEFDFIVIDTPPVLAVSDAVVLSQYADATILVVCYKQTTKQSLLRARDMLLRANARISGIVVNRMNMNSADHYYSYGYYASQQRGYYNATGN
jgi:capsular exopolysaccharide synthesis family protein